MKFIPILIVVLLCCCAGTGQISASGCFGSSCHAEVLHEGETWTDHTKILYSTCMSAGCHSSSCSGNIAATTKSNAAKERTIAEMEAVEKKGGSDRDTQELVLFTEKDSETIMGIIIASGAGLIFAGIDIFFKLSLWIVPLLMFIGLMVYSLLNKAEEHRNLIKGILVLIVIVIAVKMYFSLVMYITPDLSVIEF